MECIVPASNIKVFARAIHSLAKIGEELYVDPTKDGLAIQTVNSSKSAFASYTFKSSFFRACFHQSKTNTNNSQAGVIIPASQQILTPRNTNESNEPKCSPKDTDRQHECSIRKRDIDGESIRQISGYLQYTTPDKPSGKRKLTSRLAIDDIALNEAIHSCTPKGRRIPKCPRVIIPVKKTSNVSTKSPSMHVQSANEAPAFSDTLAISIPFAKRRRTSINLETKYEPKSSCLNCRNFGYNCSYHCTMDMISGTKRNSNAHGDEQIILNNCDRTSTESGPAFKFGIGDVLAKQQEAVNSPGKFRSVASRTVLPDGGIKLTLNRKKKPLRETFHPVRQGTVCRRVASEVGISAKQNIMTSTPSPIKLLGKKSTSPNEITAQIEQKIEDNTEETCFQGHSNVKYRVTMRGMMIAFESISELEKTTEACILTFCDKNSELKICIICKYSIIKTYTLPFVESVSPMAIYDKNVMVNRFVAKAKTLTGAVLFEAVTFDAAFQPSDICDTDVIVTVDDDDLTSEDNMTSDDDDLTSDDDDSTSDMEKIDSK